MSNTAEVGSDTERFLGKRIVAFVIDVTVAIFLTVAAMAPYFSYILETYKDQLTKMGTSAPPSMSDWPEVMWYAVFGSFLSITIPFAYMWFVEGIMSRSIGKMATGLMVVQDNRHPITLSGAFIRTLSKCIPLDLFSCFFTKDRRFWHDNLSNTIVVSRYQWELEHEDTSEF